eukprot:scaffold292883_cov36-Tisochrysis_lutea.AAC.2
MRAINRLAQEQRALGPPFGLAHVKMLNTAEATPPIMQMLTPMTAVDVLTSWLPVPESKSMGPLGISWSSAAADDQGRIL